MKNAMQNAALGDDVFNEDPSINALEECVAQLFGKEKGLFCSSGTMANQIAIKAHTQPGDQVICSWAAHIYNYEGGGMAMNSGVTAKLLDGSRGLFKAQDVEAAILDDHVYYPVTRLVALEDTTNKGGGAIWNVKDISDIKKTCEAHNLSMHLDGARLFNRLVADGTDKLSYAKNFDSMSICFSKGLGAPVGSILLGTDAFIYKARRIRKVFGGGMRQAGMLAAAASYALDHHVDRLSDDHAHAKDIADVLSAHPSVSEVMPVETNIIIFQVQADKKADDLIKLLSEKGVLAFATGPRTIRFVLHLDVSSAQVEELKMILKELKF
jgi:threonine aldolase